MRDRYSSIRMERSGLESTQAPDVESYIEARDEVRAVMAMLSSSIGPVVWDTCGNGMSLRQHVGRVTGRSVPEGKAGLYQALISWPRSTMHCPCYRLRKTQPKPQPLEPCLLIRGCRI